MGLQHVGTKLGLANGAFWHEKQSHAGGSEQGQVLTVPSLNRCSYPPAAAEL
jgi:hypothetical protein